MDAHKNFAYATVLVAPIPASSGTALTVGVGQGAGFPATPFNATVWPIGALALATNAEIVRVTNIVGDVLTITRIQESTSARTIIVGDQIAATMTVKTFTDIETGFAGTNSAITGGSMTVNTSGISINLPAYLTTAALSGDTTKYAGVGFTTTTGAGAVVAGTHNTAGLLLAVPAFLTTADLSANSSKYAGINGAITGGSITVNTSGVSVNLPAYLTTAMQSNAATISNINVSAAGSSNNLSNVVFSNLNGVSFGLTGSTLTGSVAPATASVLNLSVVGSSNTFGSVVFSNSNGYTFGLNAATVTMAGPFQNWLEPYPLETATNTVLPVAGSWYLAPFTAFNSMAGGRFNLALVGTGTANCFQDIGNTAYVSSSTGTLSQVMTFQMGVALFSQGTGANTTRLESCWSNTFTFGHSKVLNVSTNAATNIAVSLAHSLSYIQDVGSNGAYTLSQTALAGSSTIANSSAGSTQLSTVASTIRNMVTGSWLMPVGFNTTISAGNYWLGVCWNTTMGSTTTGALLASANEWGMSALMGMSRLAVNSLYRNFGSTATAAGSAFIPYGVLTGATNTAPPTNIAISSDLASTASQWVPYFNYVMRGLTK